VVKIRFAIGKNCLFLAIPGPDLSCFYLKIDILWLFVFKPVFAKIRKLELLDRYVYPPDACLFHIPAP